MAPDFCDIDAISDRVAYRRDRYFAAGMTDEPIVELARVLLLRVIFRTSLVGASLTTAW